MKQKCLAANFSSLDRNPHNFAFNVDKPTIVVTHEDPEIQETSFSVDKKGTETFDTIPKGFNRIWKSILGQTEVTFSMFEVIETGATGGGQSIISGFNQRLPHFQVGLERGEGTLP